MEGAKLTPPPCWFFADIFPMWPVMLKRLRLTQDGETRALIDFFGGRPRNIEVSKASARVPLSSHMISGSSPRPGHSSE